MQLQKFTLTAVLFFLFVFICSCHWGTAKPSLKNGTWRASIQRVDGQSIVFNMETKDSAGKKILYVINGGERLLVDKVSIKGDSVYIEMPFFESAFAARVQQNGNLQGSWLKKGADSIRAMPFSAVYNQQRFPGSKPALHKISGRWSVTFKNASNVVTDAVGEFEQDGSHLTGTFLTATGDYRYLEGVVSGDSLKLSAFDGDHAYLFTANIDDDKTISAGKLYAGAVGVEQWSAVKNETASLPDGYAATSLRPGETTLNFSFKSTDDKMVSIKDERYKGKVVVIQIMGSWCPNCMDETRFLSDYYKAHRKDGVEVIALAYERSTDIERSKKSLLSFQQRFDVTYPVLLTGVTVTDSLRTEKTLPQLNKIKAFPTSIFIDKKGIVRKIYTGFTGPGTGVHYKAFKKEFDETIRQLLGESF